MGLNHGRCSQQAATTGTAALQDQGALSAVDREGSRQEAGCGRREDEADVDLGAACDEILPGLRRIGGPTLGAGGGEAGQLRIRREGEGEGEGRLRVPVMRSSQDWVGSEAPLTVPLDERLGG